MTTIQSATTAAAPAAIASGSRAATDIQDRFLKLLITQIQNQDPLNPLDNAQVTTQLAQINTVNGIAQLNATMQTLASSLNSSQSMQSASLIGRTVITEGNALTLTQGSPALGGVDLTQAAESVKVSIVAPAGNVVRQIDLGARAPGIAGFQWDGLTDSGVRAAPGAYTFQVKALTGGKDISALPVAAGTVSSITLGSHGLRLGVDGVGEVEMRQIKSIM